MNRTGRTRARRFALWCILLGLVMIISLAAGENQIQIVPDEWSWEANTTSAFHGSVILDQACEDAEMSLKVETRLEDSGEAVFTDLNGKRLKIRKQAPVVSADLPAGEEFTFEAEWNLPADTDTGIAHAVIHLEIHDSEGNVIASGSTEIGSVSEERKLAGVSPVRRVELFITWMAAASAAVWALAVLRHLLLNRKRA